MSRNNKSTTTYNVLVECSNCGFHGELEIDRGKEVNCHKCPNCGCAKLSRTNRTTNPWSWPFNKDSNTVKPERLEPYPYHPWSYPKRTFPSIHVGYTDATSWKRAAKRCLPVWEVERIYRLPAGSLKANRESR